MFFSSNLQKFKNIKHCFFSRKNGVSQGLYKSLNCGLGSHDNKISVKKNLDLVAEKFSFKRESLITLNQKHTNKVIHFKNEKSVENKLTGDSVVSEVKNIAIGVLTADCVPILFYNPKKKIIGCVHSGWKGALDGIIKNTIEKFKELDANNEDLIVAVGPCIGKDSYEVKNDFLKKFIDKDKYNENFFKKINNDHYNFDLRGFVNKELSNLNIKNIENVEIDTFSQPEFFYSYRRSVKNNEPDYGRCISVILMT